MAYGSGHDDLLYERVKVDLTYQTQNQSSCKSTKKLQKTTKARLCYGAPNPGLRGALKVNIIKSDN